MFSTLITVTLFVSLVIQGAFAGFAINTPKLVECTPAQISWEPTTAPYAIEIVSASDPCGNALRTIPGLSSTTYNYISDLKAGTKVLLFIADSAGNEAWSNEITIGGSSSACTPGASSTTSPSTPVNNPTPQTAPSPSSSPAPGLGGAINAGSSSSGMLTVHRASTPLLFTALAALLALTL